MRSSVGLIEVLIVNSLTISQAKLPENNNTLASNVRSPFPPYPYHSHPSHNDALQSPYTIDTSSHTSSSKSPHKRPSPPLFTHHLRYLLLPLRTLPSNLHRLARTRDDYCGVGRQDGREFQSQKELAEERAGLRDISNRRNHIRKFSFCDSTVLTLLDSFFGISGIKEAGKKRGGDDLSIIHSWSRSDGQLFGGEFTESSILAGSNNPMKKDFNSLVLYNM